MGSDFLKEIVGYKRSLIKKKKAFFEQLKEQIDKTEVSRYCLFKQAISTPGRLNLIAEIKKASPSLGLIRSEFDVCELARFYVESNVDAISVLTEDKFFLGNPAYIEKVSDNFKVPVLAKDFFIDELPIYEAYNCGAAAILLIVAILTDDQLKNFIQVAAKLDIDCLVEIHNERELDRAIKAGAEIIGINNRDLVTFNVDIEMCQRLIPQIPKEKIIVAESGIKSHDDILMLKELGAHAVLIGETFLRAADVKKKITEVMEGKS